MGRLLPVAGLLFGLVACGLKAPPVAPGARGVDQGEGPLEEGVVAEVSPSVQEADAGVSDPDLRLLLRDHWEHVLVSSPVWATILGDHRYDDLLPDNSPEGYAASRTERDGFLERARRLDRWRLDDADKLTLDLFVAQLSADQREDQCRLEQWTLTPRTIWPRSNPLVVANELTELHQVKSTTDGAHLIARYRLIPQQIDGEIANLRLGLADGLTSHHDAVQDIIDQFEGQLALDDAQWPQQRVADEASAHWPYTFQVEFREEVATTIRQVLRPAFVRFLAFLKDEVAPRAREGDQVGLSALPEGAACYEALIAYHTSLDRSPAELHATGLAELERIHAEMADLGESLFDTRDLDAIFERLRTDPALHFETEGQVEEKAVAAVAKAQAVLPEVFSRLPATEVVVRPIPPHEAPSATIAYYRPATADGSRPGVYFINILDPQTRPRYEAEVLAFHEAIPGHHLQISLAQELPDLPAFRRYAGMTAYVEGWALYSERLADELGLYSGPVDRMGMLSFDSWRAARLVVDTGIHHEGWSAEEGVAFFLANTPLAENNVRNEVDRYVTSPGQALAYKTGQLEVLALRAEAERALGDRFDLPAFHAVLLHSGAVPLSVLRERVEAWVASGGLEDR